MIVPVNKLSKETFLEERFVENHKNELDESHIAEMITREKVFLTKVSTRLKLWLLKTEDEGNKGTSLYLNKFDQTGFPLGYYTSNIVTATIGLVVLLNWIFN